MKQKINEIDVIDIQLFATILSILSLIGTFTFLYNQKLLRQKKKPLFSKKITLDLVAINRIFILLIVIVFLSANYFQFQIDKEENKDLVYDYIEIFSSILTLIVACLAIYTAFKAIEEQDLSIDTIIDSALG